jgi:hypothetical protein
LVAQHAPHWLGPSQAVSYDYIICIGDIYIMLSLPPRHRELGCAHRESCMHVHACTQYGLADVTSTPMHCTACYCMFLIGLWLSLPWRKKIISYPWSSLPRCHFAFNLVSPFSCHANALLCSQLWSSCHLFPPFRLRQLSV